MATDQPLILKDVCLPFHFKVSIMRKLIRPGAGCCLPPAAGCPGGNPSLSGEVSRAFKRVKNRLLGRTFKDCQVGSAEASARSAQPQRLRLKGGLCTMANSTGKTGSQPRAKANSFTLLQYTISSIVHVSIPLLCLLKLINTLTRLTECMVSIHKTSVHGYFIQEV